MQRLITKDWIILDNQWNKKIVSLEDLMSHWEFNTELWNIISSDVNMRTTTMKMSDWETKQVENYQVKAKLQPKVDPKQMQLADLLKWYEPPTWDSEPKVIWWDRLWTIFIPDAHIGKLDIKWTSLSKKMQKIKNAFINLLRREQDMWAEEFLIVSLWDTLNSDMNWWKTTKWTPMENNASERDMRKAAVDLFAEIGDRAWEKWHTTMRFIPWNHDQQVTVPLNTTMDFVFKNHKSVDVKWDADTRQYHRFWNTLIWLTHWDTVKPKDLPNIMVNEANQSWVKKREWYLWHRHKMIAEDIWWTLVTSLPAVCEKNKRWKDFGVDLTNNIMSWSIHEKKFWREAILFQEVVV